MTSRPAKNNGGKTSTENLAFIRQMLGELRQVAENEGAGLLCYLLEMAYVEAGDLQSGQRRLASIQHGE